MRKLVIVSVLIFLTIFGFGQMMFNNIQLGGPYYNFKLELQKKGFDYHSDSEKEAENIFSYTGKFIDKDVELGVMVTPKTKIVWKVNVELPVSNTWTSLKSDFFDLQKKMTQKYGSAYNGHAIFLAPSYEGDGNELLAIFQDKCSYDSYWKTENGFIVIKIISHAEGTALINISYEDKKASAINTAEKDKIIMDGL
jgi:hypothetical protein